MERTQNVILFSAGESLDKVNFIRDRLAPHGIRCFGWRELFTTAHDSSRIALLPNLVKKIPSFDFAVILAEAVDEVTLRGQTGLKSMRDNVIFELGLCIMGLGPDRVILLAEESVRIPEDLMGVGSLGIRYLTYQRDRRLEAPVDRLGKEILDRRDAPPLAQLDAIIRHIEANAQTVSPVFVGAAVSSAEAYFQNFLLRLLRNLSRPILRQGCPVSPREIRVHICFPAPEALPSLRQRLPDFYGKLDFFVIPGAGSRDLSFRGTLEDGVLTVMDVPTSVTASYSLVGAILSIDADADRDEAEELRFMTKEMDVYRYTLRSLCTPELAQKRLTDLPLLMQDRVLGLLETVRLLPMDVDREN